MNYKKIKEFANAASFHKFFTTDYGKVKEHKQLSMDQNFKFLNSMKEGKEFACDKDMIEFVKGLVPEKYIINHHIVFFLEGKFWILDLISFICQPHDDAPTAEHIFDIQRSGLDIFAARAGAAIEQLQLAINDYETSSEYQDWHYCKVEKVETPNEKYDNSFSLTKEESDNMTKWSNEHFKKFHKPKYKGAIGVSDFELRWRATSVGTYCDYVCTECEKAYKEALDTDNEKLAKKIEKKMSYEVRGLE